MKLLILGGTVFVGRAIAEAALAQGHEITLFHRGQHGADLFPEAEKLFGNRDGELDALRGRQWDAVIDTCGYLPRVVRQSAQLLADSVEHYAFISSISVYADFHQPWDENGPLGQISEEDAEAAQSITGENYGPLKVKCESIVEQALPGRALIVRPGLIVGPHDPTDRFTYWPVRVERSGSVLVPGSESTRVQIIDVRDLAEWTIRCLETRTVGIFNAVGPENPLTMQEMLAACKTETNSDADFVFVPGDFLETREVNPNRANCWWVPAEADTYRCFCEINAQKSIAAGLTYRPLATTVRDTLNWAKTRPEDWKWQAGLTPEQETELLTAWANRA